jgi:hypothetical protein
MTPGSTSSRARCGTSSLSDWSFGLGAFWEEYVLKDTQTGQVLYYVYMPSSFFLNAVNGDYNAWVGWLNLTYSF